MSDYKNRYAFSTGALYPLESEEALRLIAQAGFAHAELMPQCFADMDDQAALRFEKAKVHIASIHYPLVMFPMLYSAHPSMAKEGRALSEKIVALGQRLGTEYLVIHPTLAYEGELKQIIEPSVVENIRFLGNLCAENSITLAMENYPVGVGQHPDTLQAYVKHWNMPEMKIMVDTTEVMEGGEEPVAFINALEEAPCHLHLSDFGNKMKHLPIGKGEIPWADVFSLLDAKGFSGNYTLEPSYRHYLSGISEKLRRDFDVLRSFV
ncbi:MAG: sugar phosphate isomerase/epimerase family protein [Sphaerochaetaceae bacterium]